MLRKLPPAVLLLVALVATMLTLPALAQPTVPVGVHLPAVQRLHVALVDPPSTEAPGSTATATGSPTATPSVTGTPTPSATPGPSPTATSTLTPSRTRTATLTRTPTPTRTPSPTRTPTLTRTPSSTPAPSATPTPMGVAILCHSSFGPAFSGTQYVVAEVINDTPAPIYNVVLAATFYDFWGKAVATQDGYARLDMVAPHETTSVKITVTASGTWSRYEVRLASYQASTYFTYNHDFALLSPTVTRQGDALHVSGEVRNDTGRAWRYVKVLATLYDSHGCIVDTNLAFLDPGDLAPGEQGPFDIAFTGSQLSHYAGYHLTVEGWH